MINKRKRREREEERKEEKEENKCTLNLMYFIELLFGLLLLSFMYCNIIYLFVFVFLNIGCSESYTPFIKVFSKINIKNNFK